VKAMTSREEETKNSSAAKAPTTMML